MPRLIIVSFLLARSECNNMDRHSFGLKFLNWVCHQFSCFQKLELRTVHVLHFLLNILFIWSEFHFLDKADFAFIFLEIRRFNGQWTLKHASVSWYHEFLDKSLIVKYDSNDYSFSIEKMIIMNFVNILFDYLWIFSDQDPACISWMINRKYGIIKATNLKFDLDT